MKKRTALFVAGSVAALAVGAAVVGGVALLFRGRGAGPSWTRGESYLSVTLANEIPEQPPSELEAFFEKRPPSLRTLVESLDRAATDPSVKATVLRVNLLPDVGWARIQELRDAVDRFRKSGKPAYAHLESGGNKEYYLAAACDKVYAVPTALLDVSGLAAEVTFFRKTLDKLGVEAQFVGVGKYKNAPNQFTETGFTEPHREQTEALLDSLFEQFVAGIAAGRGKAVPEVRALVDAGPYDARQALAAGLVDELLYQDELEARLRNAERLTPSRYVKAKESFGLAGRPRLALVYALGEIVPGESQGTAFGGQLAGSDTVARAVRQARTEAGIRAIVLRVDSPGGSGTASDVIWREVERAARGKPVVVSMGDVAASGGYYVAMAGSAIVAQPGTITGSIGVFGGKFSLRGLYEKIGITKEIVVRGRNAALFTKYRPWNEEEAAKVQGLLGAFYEEFVTKAARGRRRSYEQVDAVAQGRVWTGTDALRVGLVDRLGGLEAAIGLAKEKAGIPAGQEIEIVILPERKGLFETFMERQEEAAASRSLPTEVRALARWAWLLDGRGPIARLPFELRVR